MLLYRRLLHSLDNYGPSGTLKRLWRTRLLSRDAAAEFTDRPVMPHPYDVLHGTDTGGWIPGEQLTSGTRSDLYNTAYYGISPSTLAHALNLIGLLPPGTGFIDLGCGKGRALLTAAAFPFTNLLGVDLSDELCGIARANAARMGLARVNVLRQDATTLAYPEGPLVIFLYHPFLAPVLRRVLENFERQRAQSPHPTWLLYANPQYPKIFARLRCLHPVWDCTLKLSEQDRLADSFGTAQERYALFTIQPPS